MMAFIPTHPHPAPQATPHPPRCHVLEGCAGQLGGQVRRQAPPRNSGHAVGAVGGPRAQHRLLSCQLSRQLSRQLSKDLRQLSIPGCLHSLRLLGVPDLQGWVGWGVRGCLQGQPINQAGQDRGKGKRDAPSDPANGRWQAHIHGLPQARPTPAPSHPGLGAASEGAGPPTPAQLSVSPDTAACAHAAGLPSSCSAQSWPAAAPHLGAAAA